MIYEKATRYMEAGDNVRAKKFYKKIIDKEEMPEALLNYGAILKGEGKLKEAAALFKRCIAANPKWAFPYSNLGLIYHNWNLDKEAEPYFRRAISLMPSYADAHWNLGLSLLKRGYSGETELLAEGWKEYSWRFRKSGPVKLAVVPHLPLYDGTQSRCLIVPEQGFGDFIMFTGFIQDNMDILPIDRFVELGDALGVRWATDSDTYDSWLPMCSLPGIASYTKRGRSTGGSGIGVCWRGNPEHGNDKFRSRLDSDFAWLGEAVNLQFGSSSRIFGDCKLKSWEDTINALRGLELFVTVDTSVAHLAGWLGVPTICLVPSIDTDFRWGLKRSDNEWYSSLVVARSMDEVKKYVSSFKA